MILKPLIKEDLPFYIEVHNDPVTLQYIGDCKPISLEETERWFSIYKNQWYVIVNNNKKVGIFKTIKHKKWVEIGCDIYPDYRRRGYARKAYNMFLNDIKKLNVFLCCFEDNPAMSLYKELGFKVVDDQKEIRGRKYIKMIRI